MRCTKRGGKCDKVCGNTKLKVDGLLDLVYMDLSILCPTPMLAPPQMPLVTINILVLHTRETAPVTTTITRVDVRGMAGTAAPRRRQVLGAKCVNAAIPSPRNKYVALLILHNYDVDTLSVIVLRLCCE